MLDLGQKPIQPPYRLCYRERHGLRELLEYEPKYRWVKQRCANCGYKQTVWGEEGIDGYRMYPGEKYRMDGIVSLCKICKEQVLPGHQERHPYFYGTPISRPVMGMPIQVLEHGDVGDYQVSRAVETVWKNIPRRDRKKIKDYIVDDQRKDSDYCGSVVGRGVLSVEVLWDWPSRKRGVSGTCAADGHFIRLRSREVKGDFECVLGLFAHELAHTFQYATGSVLLTGQVFERLSIRTIGQLRQMPINTLNELFGSAGEHYWQLAHGIDDRRVVPDREAKSISNETTFAADISDMEVLRAWLVELVDQVAQRLRRHDLKGRTVELKVRFADFKTISRSLTLAEPSNVTQELLDAGIELLTKRLPPRHLPVRLLGFGVNKLDDSGTSQQQLFDQPDRQRHRELDRVADQITAKFGKLAIRRGTGLKPGDD